MFPEEVYRIGNYTSHKLTNTRVGEIDIVQINGVNKIVPNGKCVSLYTTDGVFRIKLRRFASQFKKGFPVESGLRLISDRDPSKMGHYHLCPTEQMPIDVYKKML